MFKLPTITCAIAAVSLGCLNGCSDESLQVVERRYWDFRQESFLWLQAGENMSAEEAGAPLQRWTSSGFDWFSLTQADQGQRPQRSNWPAVGGARFYEESSLRDDVTVGLTEASTVLVALRLEQPIADIDSGTIFQLGQDDSLYALGVQDGEFVLKVASDQLALPVSPKVGVPLLLNLRVSEEGLVQVRQDRRDVGELELPVPVTSGLREGVQLGAGMEFTLGFLAVMTDDAERQWVIELEDSLVIALDCCSSQ